MSRLQHKTQFFWIALLLVAFSAFSYFFAQMSIKAYQYFVYSIPVTPKTMHWKVKEVESGVYKIEVNYWFNYQNKNYQHSYLFKQKEFGNKTLAYEQIQFLQQNPWTAWLSKWNVEESTLERSIPLKLVVRAFLAFIVFGYFLFLRSYLSRSYQIEGKRFEI